MVVGGELPVINLKRANSCSNHTRRARAGDLPLLRMEYDTLGCPAVLAHDAVLDDPVVVFQVL